MSTAEIQQKLRTVKKTGQQRTTLELRMWRGMVASLM